MLEKLKTSTFSWKRLYQREETVWTQNVLWDWIIKMDRNSKYFQMVARNHRLWNWIQQIKDDQGCWVDSQEGIFQCFQNYFQRLYTSQQTYEANQIQEQLSIVPLPAVSMEKKNEAEGACLEWRNHSSALSNWTVQSPWTRWVTSCILPEVLEGGSTRHACNCTFLLPLRSNSEIPKPLFPYTDS